MSDDEDYYYDDDDYLYIDYGPGTEADDLAEHTLASPVFLGFDPYFNLNDDVSDWQYYSDDWFDELLPGPANTTTTATTATAATASQQAEGKQKQTQTRTRTRTRRQDHPTDEMEVDSTASKAKSKRKRRAGGDGHSPEKRRRLAGITTTENNNNNDDNDDSDADDNNSDADDDNDNDDTSTPRRPLKKARPRLKPAPARVVRWKQQVDSQPVQLELDPKCSPVALLPDWRERLGIPNRRGGARRKGMEKDEGKEVG